MTQLSGQKWYCDSSKYSSVTAWAASTAYAAGALVRQLATPAVGSERVFVCLVAGTSNSTEPTWTTTEGAKTTDNTATWMECTGKAGVNGDLADTTVWSSIKSTAVSLGVIVQRASAGSLQICTTAGTTGSGTEPSFSNTAGTTTTDNTVTWTSLGAPSNFAAWAAPWARLYPALTGTVFAVSTDVVYVGSGHAETQATAMTYDAPPNNISLICVSNATGSLPTTTLATTASVSTTGASSIIFGPTANSYLYMYGINLYAGSGTNTANLSVGFAGSMNCEQCGFNLNNSSASSLLYISQNAANAGYVQLRGCTLTFGSTSQSMFWPTTKVDVYGGSIASTGSVPATLVAGDINQGGKFRVMDCDLSALTGTLFTTTTNGVNTEVSVENCKLNSGVTITNGAAGIANAIVKLHNSDSAATNYRYGYYKFPGSVVSNTSIVRTGGATNGATQMSWQVATTSSAGFYFPFITEEIAVWNSLTGSSHTATVYLTSNAALTNALCWLELEYPGSASSPLGATVTTRAAPLATGTALTADTSTWGGTAQTFIYSISASFTPQMAGPLKARLYVADPSITVYLDPLIVVV